MIANTPAIALLTDWELCANHYVLMHGDDAPAVAARRCDELLDGADFEGVRNYQEIIRRINKLLDRLASTAH